MTEVGKALVSGVTGGIGGQVVDQMASQGWDLILMARQQTQAQKLRERLMHEYPGQSFWAYAADMMDRASLSATLTQISHDHPSLNALINLAGVLSGQPRHSEAGIEWHVHGNVLAAHQIQEALRASLARGADTGRKSVVLHMSSGAANGAKDPWRKGGTPNFGKPGMMGAYATSKAMIAAMVAHDAAEWASEGILLRAVDPGPTATGMARGDGVPVLVRPFSGWFKKPETSARQILAALPPEAMNGASGLFVARGRQRRMPRLAANTGFQDQVAEFIRQSA
ncbi:SDR family NAD(P)-dependent oxidoreductase [Shimia biformata]|uniref:SDR family NAD(P)-dependent oxidoreductase n=1 Tax=Shimia biformata TaxID=1294299 RepID=UPI00194E3D22|nr:SDR family oxidoreductase [Shimia biformata]